jgi:hexosaminidase
MDHYEVWLDGANVANVTSPGYAPNANNLALGKNAVASSTQSAGFTPAKVTDGILVAPSRWESQYSDPQWIYVDLGQPMKVTRVRLTWETAYGRAYQIQVSNDATNWTSIYSTTTGDGGTDDLTSLSGYGRYVRMYGTTRATGYGYSLFEFEVYGGPVEMVTRTGLSASTHTWYVVAVDAFGNRRQSTSTYTFTVH